MKFDLTSRRPITEEEKQRGIDWLNANGFEFVSVANGKIEFYQARHHSFWIIVNSPKSGWWLHIRDEQGNNIVFQDGQYSECEEAVKEAVKESGIKNLLNSLFGNKEQ